MPKCWVVAQRLYQEPSGTKVVSSGFFRFGIRVWVRSLRLRA